MSNTKNAPSPAQYIDTIINNSSCGRHSAMTKMPCFNLTRDDGSNAIGVCDFRAKKFFNGKISAAAIKGSKAAPRFKSKKK